MSENLNNEELEREEAAQTQNAEQNESSGNEADVENLEAKQNEEQEDFKKKFYYLAAEMDNMKKRFEREKQNLLKYGNEKLLNGLVEVVDNFDRTLQALETEEEDKKILNIVEGIKMVKSQMSEVLEKNGLEEVDAQGKIFDPNYHEAMAQQPSEDKEDQEVVSVFQKGYVLNGRLLRPAKVVVAKNEKQ